MRAAGAELLTAAQKAGRVRTDLEINALLNLANAVALAIEHRPHQSTLAMSVLTNGIRPD
ncbi:SbtR family transcriptional regulator [Nocardia bovistercoris]|uniref:Transcriptional regulator SbtR-like C-terminal domain-containing protein n=1 Tax=Nocardia bovistercoris TaxID=2785916 RepID=A0A931N7E5_9NOCA|nr:hypothetical protein [Nocardia bovistercoris]MBH0781702.1 hypothetical protein [Nocardia bovistercoris]